MKVFLAGATGVVGRRLIPELIAAGHEVVGLARTPEKARLVRELGAEPVVADAFDRRALTAAVVAARPDCIVHQLTALGTGIDFRNFDDSFARTNRLRTFVTDVLLAAAREAGTRRFIAQSFCGWTYAREGGPVKSETDRLDPTPPAPFRRTFDAIRYLETAVLGASLHGLVLRYGWFYGPGTSMDADSETARLIRQRKFPIVGDGAGVWSFAHIDDVAHATALAVERGPADIYNIVDDEPAPVFEWLPYLANALGAKPPRRIPAWLARLFIGEGGVAIMTTIRGASNAHAQRVLQWELKYPSWRKGFVEGL